MTLEKDLACLRSIALFKALPTPRLKLVALTGERLHYEAGAVLGEAGEPPDGVLLILEGELVLSQADGEGTGFVFETGSILGDVPILCGERYLGTVSARTDVEVLRLPRDLFFELMNTVPEFAMALTRDLAGRLYRLAGHVLHRDEPGQTLRTTR